MLFRSGSIVTVSGDGFADGDDFASVGVLTLPDRCQSSTIGTEELNFCVRYGNRWNLFVIATGNCELFRKSLS